MFHVPEKYRVREGLMGSDERDGNNGMFMVPRKKARKGGKPFTLKVIASDGLGWEHVSVSLYNRPPTWEEMCRIKDMFWDEEDMVIQYHPAKSQYVNNHPNCLHLWRPIGQNVPFPDYILVGIR